jgi:hypothetical protein
MALESGVPIIPFATVGRYKPFKKGIIVRFGKPYKPKKDIQKSTDELRNIVKDLLER